MTRNTPVLTEILDLIHQEDALEQLETYFHERLIVDAVNIATVGEHAVQLRLNITREECADVLDYIAEQRMVNITVDHVETAVWELLGNRFIEP